MREDERVERTAENDAPQHVAGRCFAANGDVPCQKGAGHGGGHWFMSDGMFACLDAGHYDPTNVLSLTSLVHLDMPCPRRVIPPEVTHCANCGAEVPVDKPHQVGECVTPPETDATP